jgi:hypothetical protein
MPSKTIIPKRMREDRSAWTGRDELITSTIVAELRAAIQCLYQPPIRTWLPGGGAEGLATVH